MSESKEAAAKEIAGKLLQAIIEEKGSFDFKKYLAQCVQWKLDFVSKLHDEELINKYMAPLNQWRNATELWELIIYRLEEKEVNQIVEIFMD
jgi:hypothetical protein